MAVKKKTPAQDWKAGKPEVPESFRRLCQAKIRVPTDAEARRINAIAEDIVGMLEAKPIRG